MWAALFLAVPIAATTVGAPAVTTSGACPNGGAPGVIYDYTAPANGRATVQVCGPYDTVAAIRLAGAQIACSDDATNTCGRADNSRVSWDVAAGVRYQVVVTGYKGPTSTQWQGQFTLSIDGPAAAVDNCEHSAVTFGLDGTTCTAARLALPCACSEAIQWEPASWSGREADFYQVARRSLPGGVWWDVGDTRPHNFKLKGTGQFNADGDEIAVPDPIWWWLPLWDSDTAPPLLFGQAFEYSVTACWLVAGSTTCAVADRTKAVPYTPPHVACYEGGKLVTRPGCDISAPIH